jgi:hypothetical protein
MKIQLPEEILKDLKSIKEGYKSMSDINLEYARLGFHCENDACEAYEKKLEGLNYYGS